MEPLPQPGDPDAILCRHCGRARLIRTVSGAVHRLCPHCDTPDKKTPDGERVPATWESEAWR